MSDEKERISVEDEVHFLVLGERYGEFGEGLHVRFATETWSDDEDVETLEEGCEFWAEFFWRTGSEF